MKMTKGLFKRAVSIAFFAGALSIFGACDRFPFSDRLSLSDAPARGEVRIQLHSEPISFDPALTEDGLGFRVIGNLYRGLFRVDPSGKVVPDLGTVRSLSADGLTYEIELESDARWSDGVKLTSEHVRFGIERAREPKRIAKYGRFLERIRGIEIRSERVIAFRLSRPDPLFLGILTLPLAFPLRPDFLDSDGRFDLRRKGLAFSGAYRVSEYVTDQRIVLDRWRTPAPDGIPTRVRFQIVRDESTARSLFEAGKLDVLTKISPYDIDELKKTGRLKVAPYAATYFLGFNLEDPRVRSVSLRRRIRDAIRREELVGLLKAGERPAYSFLPEGFEGYREFPYVKGGPLPDVVKTNGEVTAKEPALELSYDGTERNQAIVEKIQSDLARAGIPVQLRPADWKTHSAAVYSNPSALYRFGWSTPLLDPLFFLMPFDRSSGFALGGLPKSPNLHEEVDAIAREPSGPTRVKLIADFQTRILDRDVWVVPIFHYVSTFGVSRRIGEFPVNALGGFRAEDLRLR